SKTAPPQVKADPKPIPPPIPKEAPKESKPETRPQNLGSTNGLKKEASTAEKTTSIPKNTIVVKPGDSIYSIAAKAYRVSNTSVVDRILEANPGISDPDLLPANQQIKLPLISEESLVRKLEDGSFRIRLGAFMKPEFAEYLKKQPLLQNKEIEISPFTSPSGKTWYRISAGKFESREEGLKTIRALKENGLSPYFEGFKKRL
ncbi:MAG: LysM peptidoglycan-binding domain-containing protein, partial [Thermodesulfobacteriota bacterium]